MLSSDDLSSLRWDTVSGAVEIIDQTLLPHTLHWVHLDSLEAYCHAISVMHAPLIGITAAFGLAHAVAENPSDTNLVAASASLMATRPTAVNLRWALETMERHLCSLVEGDRAVAARQQAIAMRQADIDNCALIGENGLGLLRDVPHGEALNIMTHCNAGWLATIQWGTALAPIYKAQAFQCTSGFLRPAHATRE